MNFVEQREIRDKETMKARQNCNRFSSWTGEKIINLN